MDDTFDKILQRAISGCNSLCYLYFVNANLYCNTANHIASRKALLTIQTKRESKSKMIKNKKCRKPNIYLQGTVMEFNKADGIIS